MLELRAISKRQGAFMLHDVDLVVNEGQCHVLLGPTGCGKTTLLELALGLVDPNAGEILLDGVPITGRPIGRRGISYLPQDLALFPHLSVRQNIYYPLRVRGLSGERCDALADEVIDALGIRPLLARPTTNLSGGEQQRVALARALVTGDRFLFLDEPLAALHEGMKRELWMLLRDLLQRFNLGVLMVTHHLEEAYFLADSISILIAGRVAQTGPKHEVYERPVSVDVARFLGAQNLFPARVVDRSGAIARVRCDALNLELSVDDARIGRRASTVCIGFRAEHVRVGVRGHERRNRIRVHLLKKVSYGARVALIVKPEGAERTMVLDVPLRKESRLEVGQAIDVVVPEENIFVMSDLCRGTPRPEDTACPGSPGARSRDP